VNHQIAVSRLAGQTRQKTASLQARLSRIGEVHRDEWDASAFSTSDGSRVSTFNPGPSDILRASTFNPLIRALWPCQGFPFNERRDRQFPRLCLIRALRSLAIELIESPFQLRIGASNLIDDCLRPIEILALALQRPIGRRAGNDVSEVAYLVGQRHKFGVLGRFSRLSRSRLCQLAHLTPRIARAPRSYRELTSAARTCRRPETFRSAMSRCKVAAHPEPHVGLIVC
jgi:hypothetical protein